MDHGDLGHGTYNAFVRSARRKLNKDDVSSGGQVPMKASTSPETRLQSIQGHRGAWAFHAPESPIKRTSDQENAERVSGQRFDVKARCEVKCAVVAQYFL